MRLLCEAVFVGLEIHQEIGHARIPVKQLRDEAGARSAERARDTEANRNEGAPKPPRASPATLSAPSGGLGPTM
jgi:hypothetical protein